MKSHNYILAGLLLAGLAGAARAQVAANPSDLIIGFTAAGGSGAATNVEVDLGSVGAFFNNSSAAIGGTVFQLGNINTVLSNAYGSDWATNTTTGLQYGLIGATVGLNTGPNGQVAKTVWLSSVETAGFPAVLPNQGTSGAQGTPNANISGVYGGFANGVDVSGGITGTNQLGATLRAQTIGTGASGAWSFQGSGTVFGMAALMGGATFQNSVSGGVVSSDVIQMLPSGGGRVVSDLGPVTLAANGNLTFGISAIPEPSTYAAILGAATLGLIMLRRRNQAVVTE